MNHYNKPAGATHYYHPNYNNEPMYYKLDSDGKYYYYSDISQKWFESYYENTPSRRDFALKEIK